jgi:hypothetical protein
VEVKPALTCTLSIRNVRAWRVFYVGHYTTENDLLDVGEIDFVKSALLANAS